MKQKTLNLNKSLCLLTGMLMFISIDALSAICSHIAELLFLRYLKAAQNQQSKPATKLFNQNSFISREKLVYFLSSMLHTALRPMLMN